MNISNHPDLSWYVSYSSGGLTPAFNLLLKAHLSVCPQCRCQLKRADALGAEFMFSDEESEPSQALNYIAPTPTVGATKEQPVEWGREQLTDLSEFVDHYIGGHLDGFHWMNAGKGLKVCRLSNRDDPDRMWLLRAQPGTVLPRHSHSGCELTLVLKGAYASNEGVYKAGDIEDADDETLHQPVVTSSEECLCVAAVDGPLRFSGLMPRIAQPFIGI